MYKDKVINECLYLNIPAPNRAANPIRWQHRVSRRSPLLPRAAARPPRPRRRDRRRPVRAAGAVRGGTSPQSRYYYHTGAGVLFEVFEVIFGNREGLKIIIGSFYVITLEGGSPPRADITTTPDLMALLEVIIF